MNIPISELRSFQRLSAPIVNSNTLPILGYVKFGNGKIVKTVLTSFIEFDCKVADTDMLAEESLLYVKIGKARSEFLNFSKKSNKVTITDSVVPTTFQVPEYKEFPVLPSPTSEKYQISENFMRVLQKAQHFPKAYDATNLSWMSFIMIGDGHMCSSDGHAFFMEPIDEDCKIVLDARHAKVISKMPINGYAESSNFMFFYGEGFTIGFAKQEIGYSNIVKYGDTSGVSIDFVGSASDFEKFNDECAQSSKIPWVLMGDGILSMCDSDRDTRVEIPLASVKPSLNFTYNPKTMNRILSAIEGDEIEFYRGKDWYWIKSPSEKSTTLIMKLLDDDK